MKTALNVIAGSLILFCGMFTLGALAAIFAFGYQATPVLLIGILL